MVEVVYCGMWDSASIVGFTAPVPEVPGFVILGIDRSFFAVG